MADEKIKKMIEDELFFFGEYSHSIDSQRRVAIPKNWRAKGSNLRFFLLPGRHKALQLIPFNSFKEIFEKIRKISFADPKASLALAKLGSMAQECECDSQGRIAISPRLMEEADLSDYAIMVGAISTAQIYSPDNWKKIAESDESALDVVQKIMEKPDDLASILKGQI